VHLVGFIIEKLVIFLFDILMRTFNARSGTVNLLQAKIRGKNHTKTTHWNTR